MSRLHPGFFDHHVHLGLIDRAALRGSPIAGVLDLGWRTDEIAGWARDSRDDPEAVRVEFAGQFLTAPGGYPSTRDWAPPGAYAELRSSDDVEAAIDDLRHAGARMVKVALNSTAGPVFDDSLLAAIVSYAHTRWLPVVVHAEGEGQATRAIRAGADLLAHTPFSESLSDHDIMVASMRSTWISTLDIHRGTEAYDVALDNLRRFIAAGGRVKYGTDLGNGAREPGLSRGELAALVQAGLNLDGLLAALTAPKWVTGLSRATWLPNDAQGAGPVDWLMSARPVRVGPQPDDAADDDDDDDDGDDVHGDAGRREG